jgi:hypothetical protein
VGLPLALLHPTIRVLLLDASPGHIAIARERALAAGLAGRVECWVGRVEDFLGEQQQAEAQAQEGGTTGGDGSSDSSSTSSSSSSSNSSSDTGGGDGGGGFASLGFHLGIALHSCSPATDLSMEAMLRARAAFVLCPCCVGAPWILLDRFNLI